jgi:uncharacterized membrane-anchored protein
MSKKLWLTTPLLLLLINISNTKAEDANPANQGMTAEEFTTSLKFHKGRIDLPLGIASINLPSTFTYLTPEDTERVLVTAWGNPPGSESLGMIFPASVSPTSQEAWGVVITYDEDGHVNDDDADSINYDDLLKEMKEGMEQANVERKKQGYDGLSISGLGGKANLR